MQNTANIITAQKLHIGKLTKQKQYKVSAIDFQPNIYAVSDNAFCFLVINCFYRI